MRVTRLPDDLVAFRLTNVHSFMQHLSRCLVALALFGILLGQIGARAGAELVTPAPTHHDAGCGHTLGHTHEDPTPERHQHGQACVTACCITLSNWTQPAAAAVGVYFASTVNYGELRQVRSGYSEPPEPGIPKHLA